MITLVMVVMDEVFLFVFHFAYVLYTHPSCCPPRPFSHIKQFLKNGQPLMKEVHVFWFGFFFF